MKRKASGNPRIVGQLKKCNLYTTGMSERERKQKTCLKG